MGAEPESRVVGQLSGRIGTMSSPDHQSNAPDPDPGKPAGSERSAESGRPAEPSAPVHKDRTYRSGGGIAGGVLLLVLAGWLGIDAIVRGAGRTPWLALAMLLLVVPLVIAFSLRPAVFANDDRLRVRNPFRVIELPWGAVAGLRSGYSNEVLDASGARYQLWAVPVSLRARKRAQRQQARAKEEPTIGTHLRGQTPVAGGPVRAPSDQIMEDLRELSEARAGAPDAQGEPSARWSWEVMGPSLAGAVLLVILLVVG